jgi:hypothetical protein
MEDFEKQALDTSPIMPTCWHRYVDDTFGIRPHGIEDLRGFQQHLNSTHANIRFTTEMEKDGSLLFLDFEVAKKPHGTLEHTVYRKPTRTDLYLCAKSHRHPSQKHAVLANLINQAKTICDTECLGMGSDI